MTTCRSRSTISILLACCQKCNLLLPYEMAVALHLKRGGTRTSWYTVPRWCSQQASTSAVVCNNSSSSEEQRKKGSTSKSDLCTASTSSKRPSQSLQAYVNALKERDLLAGTLAADGVDDSSINNVIYAGFDPTADSLHLGNLVVLTSLLRASLYGIRPIALIGGFTSLIGDPSGHSDDRTALGKVAADENAQKLVPIIERASANFAARYSIRPEFGLSIVNNRDWYSEMDLVDFFSMARKFRIGEMLKRRSVRERMAQTVGGMSYTEFSYQIMQAYDWSVLYEKFGCQVQLGGVDQLGNFDAGYTYAKRVWNTKFVGISLPLLTDSSGRKLGKSNLEQSTLWLSGQRTSPFSFYQHFIQTSDRNILSLFKWLSVRDITEILAILAAHSEKPAKLLAQKSLAEELTELVHGKSGLEVAQRSTDALYGKGFDQDFLKDVDLSTLIGQENCVKLRFSDYSTVGELAKTVLAIAGVDENNIEKTVKEGGFYVNGQKRMSMDEILTKEDHCLKGKFETLCRRGKRTNYLVQWVD